MLWLLPAALAVETGSISAELDGHRLTSLDAGGDDWLAGEPTLAHGVDGLDATSSIEALPDGQLLFRLELTNPSDQPTENEVTFPYLPGLGVGADLAYVFPALGPIVDDATGSHVRYYGGLFPMQWMTIHTDDAGLWLMSRDTTGQPKTFKLTKTTDTTATMSVIWPHVRLEPGESTVLEASLGVYDTTWHEALAAYRRWLSTWYQPAVPRNATFQRAFRMRQIHLHENAVLGDQPGAFEDGTWQLQEYVEHDIEQCGGVGWVHVFDWGMDWIHGRVGDYNPYAYLGDPQDLVDEVDALQAAGIGVGLYVEGVLLDTPSLTGLSWGDDWELESSDGDAYTNYAPSWHVCASVPEWQDHFALRNARRTELRVGADGLYVDQFGFGYQYPCHREDHDHPVPSEQIAGEWAHLAAVREASSPDLVLYTESAPADVMTQVQDGAFSESITAFRDDERTAPISMVRFGIPDFKTFQLLTQDAPLDDDVRGIRLAFFNAEGQRLMGYDDWFTDAARDEIRRTGEVLVEYADEFNSSNPLPLVETADDRVLANTFPLHDRAVWTLLNTADEAIDGVVLELDALPGAVWTDCLADQELTPEILNGFAQIELSIPAGDVGCVHASWPLDEATLVGEFNEIGELGERPELDALTSDFSVAAWVSPSEIGGVRRILASEGWSSGGWVFGLTEDDGQPALALTTIGVQDHVIRAVVPAERWTHVAAVVDGGHSVTFYVDGHPRGVVHGDTPGLVGESVWHVGSNGIDGAFDGDLEVQVWDGALTAGEVRALADIDAPLAGSIRVADPALSPTELWWSGFHDPGSGIAGYRVEVGDQALETTELGGSFALDPGTHTVRVTATDGVGQQTTIEQSVDVTTAELLHVFDADQVEVPGDGWSVRASSAGELVRAPDWSLHRDGDAVRLELPGEVLQVQADGHEVVVHLDRFTTLHVWADGVYAGLAHGTLPGAGGLASGADGVEVWTGRLEPREPTDTGYREPPDEPPSDPRCGCRSGSAVLLLGLLVTLRRRSAY